MTEQICKITTRRVLSGEHLPNYWLFAKTDCGIEPEGDKERHQKYCPSCGGKRVEQNQGVEEDAKQGAQDWLDECRKNHTEYMEKSEDLDARYESAHLGNGL